MIKGIGIDVVQIDRIKRLIEKYDLHFLKRVFTEEEILYCQKMAEPSIHFAGRWASKEAFYKALPFSLQKISSWKSVEIISDSQNGSPQIKILSTALLEAFKNYNISLCHLSISHEKEFCVALVVLE
ncbi:MAG: holo-ACP synthase [Chitinispirillaceae bacterium]|nr:holo-ACP synthase [Chitinispirillaceae bacterium]